MTSIPYLMRNNELYKRIIISLLKDSICYIPEQSLWKD